LLKYTKMDKQDASPIFESKCEIGSSPFLRSETADFII
jgi:hypothetical protein